MPIQHQPTTITGLTRFLWTCPVNRLLPLFQHRTTTTTTSRAISYKLRQSHPKTNLPLVPGILYSFTVFGVVLTYVFSNFSKKSKHKKKRRRVVMEDDESSLSDESDEDDDDQDYDFSSLQYN